MKYPLALAALVAVAAAQVDPTIIPECARKCLTDATTSATTCKEGDYSCTCKPDNKAAIQTAATGCVVSACGIDKALNEVLPASDKLCAAASAGGAASSAASVASSLASAASSAAASVSIPTSAEGSMTLPFTTAASTVTASPTATDVVITTATSSRAATTTAGNGTASTTTALPAGAAGIAPIGGLAMLLLGALVI